MRRNYRQKKERAVHELNRIGSVIICSTCGKLDRLVSAEINGKPKQDYCPAEFQSIVKGEQLPVKRNKFGNKPKTVMVNGVKRSHQSTLEADRHVYLATLERNGEIENLQTQVPFRLDVNGVHICKYYADFTYNLPGQDELIVEDTKGFLTPEFKLKAKLFRAIFGYDIVLTRQHEKRSKQVKK